MDFGSLLCALFSLIEMSLAQLSLSFTSVPMSVQVGQQYTITWTGGQSDQASF